ncbi:MAG: hypothetical protein ACTS6P_01595 [Candidatus Hodgkinia cicadicola]
MFSLLWILNKPSENKINLRKLSNDKHLIQTKGKPSKDECAIEVGMENDDTIYDFNSIVSGRGFGVKRERILEWFYLKHRLYKTILTALLI